MNGHRPRLLDAWPDALALLIIFGVGTGLRAAPVLAADFPLNDGGLFVAMVGAVEKAWPAFPSIVNYNGGEIPFGYPPIGFYVVAAYEWLTGASAIDALRVLPLTFAIASIPVAYLLYRQLLETPFRALVATGAFAIMPRAFDTLVTGGGITRSIGLFAGLGTLAMGVAMYRKGGWRRILLTGLLLAVTALSHPQAGVFTGVGVVVLWPFMSAAPRVGAVRLALTIASAAILVAPWLGIVISWHGAAMLAGAASTGASPWESLALLAGLKFSNGLVEVLGLVGAFGLFVCLLNRKWLLPLWLVATVFAGSRSGLNYGSLVVAAAVPYAVAYLLRLLRTAEPYATRQLSRNRVAMLVTLAIGAAAVLDSTAAAAANPLSPLHPLASEQRAAMNWISRYTPQNSTVLVVSGTAWWIDSASEWLPILATRRSSATVQGSEWLGPGVFAEHEQRYIWLQSCAASGRGDCVQQWRTVVEPIDYVLLTDSPVAATQGRTCCLGMAVVLQAEGADIVFSQEGVIILRLLPPAPTPA